MAFVLVALMWAFDREVSVVQGEAERVVVWSTLASLRAALVIDQLTHHVRPTTGKVADKNPFRLLQSLPSNYVGEHAMRDVSLVPPGSWVFDPSCNCVGYRLLYPQWLEPVQVTGTVWFQVGEASSDFRMAPHEDYRWLGHAM